MGVKSKLVSQYLVHQKSKSYRIEEAKIYPTKYSLSDSTGTVFDIFSLGTMRKGTNPMMGVIIGDVFCPLFDGVSYLRDVPRVERITSLVDLKALFCIKLESLKGMVKK